MAARSIALQFGSEGILVLSIHPGWVKTDMGTSAADLKVEDSISNMLGVFYALKPEHHGTFVQWEGKPLPWWLEVDLWLSWTVLKYIIVC